MRNRAFLFGPILSQPPPQSWLNSRHTSAVAPKIEIQPVSSRLQNSFVLPGPFAELLDWDRAASLAGEWMDLTQRAAEPNVFLEPGFVLPSVQHEPAARRPSFLFLRKAEAHGAAGGLIGIFVFIPPKPTQRGVLKLWINPMMAAGAPLVDANEGMAAIEGLQLYVAKHYPGIETVLLPQVNVRGPVARVLGAHAASHGLITRIFDRRSRAIVTNQRDTLDVAQNFISAKKRKELRRQRRRLEELGSLTYTSAKEPNDLRAAMERFLALEASGWKGGQSTALLSDPSTATFARTMVRNFARKNACRIDALELDGKPIAMGIVISAGDTAFYWKTAYDEAFARFSPGVLFSLDMTTHMIAEGAHELINSCAITNHPMIDHIWRERMEIGDLAVATLNASPHRVAIAMNRKTARRHVRSLAKRVYYSLLRKHPC
jgi:CelD/BcsL family acetyltransferase involved in cellulose biosynthesis